jgi:hypothetical protein
MKAKKHITFNRLNNWRKISQAWNQFDNLPDWKRNKSFALINSRGNVHKFPFVNNIYYEIGQEFRNMFFAEAVLRSHYTLFEKRELTESEKFINKPTIYICTSICQFKYSWHIKFSIRNFYFLSDCEYSKGSLITEKYFSIVAPGNMELTKSNIEKVVFNWIDKNILFPIGCFRTVQESTLKCKELIKENYREFIKSRYSGKLKAYDQTDVEKSLMRRLRRKNNIVLDDSYNIEKDYQKLKTTFYKKLTPVRSKMINLTYSDIEEFCYSEGKEVEEESIFEAIEAIENGDW